MGENKFILSNDIVEHASLNPDILVVYKCKIGVTEILREPAPNNWLLKMAQKVVIYIVT